MSRGRNMILFGLLVINISLLVAAQEETQSHDDCADIRNTTLLQRGDLLVQFLLLTRGNADCAQMFNDEALTDLEQTYFNVNRPTKVVIHGFRATGSRPTWGKELAQALLQAEDANVLMVDWVRAASFTYNQAVDNYKEVAVQISYFINKLEELGCKLESFHFIGVSLGAHVAGFVGTIFEGKVGRITALDPAGPMFKGADTFDRLDPSDALFVDVIHTDSDYFGISIPVGNVDFYLNGGEDQTGCTLSRFPAVDRYVMCDHMRAVYVFISSLSSSCQLTGIPCLNYDSFLNGQCVDCDATGGTCPSIGLSENAGIGSAVIPQEQKVYLITTALPPYCVKHILVELEISRLSRKAELEVTLRTGNMTTKQTLQLSTNSLVYKRVLGHPTALCEINSIEIRNTGGLFLTQKDVNILSVCLSEIPYVGDAEPVCMENVAVSRGAPWSHDLVQVCDA